MTGGTASAMPIGRRPHYPGRHILVMAGMSAVTVAVFALAMIARLPA
jgi:hypothetical protein